MVRLDLIRTKKHVAEQRRAQVSPCSLGWPQEPRTHGLEDQNLFIFVEIINIFESERGCGGCGAPVIGIRGCPVVRKVTRLLHRRSGLSHGPKGDKPIEALKLTTAAL